MNSAIFLIAASFLFGCQAWVKEMENDGLYEGDMVLDEAQRKELANGNLGYATTIGKQWPGGKIYYSIDRSLAGNSQALTAIDQAVAEYHSRTCLRFERRTSQRAYIEFFKGGGCFSGVGYSGGKMRVSLGQGCWRKSTTVHEIAHALGVYHEQSRPDRDRYVNIHFENIRSNMRYNFNKQSGIDSLGTPYDYNSVMHYKSKAFSSNGRATITKKDGSTNFGNDYGLSSIDAQQINLLYKRQCGGTNPPPPTQGPPRTRKPWTDRPPPPGCHDTHPSCGGSWPKSYCRIPGVATYCRRMCGKC